MLRRPPIERARPAAARMPHNLSRVGVALSSSGALRHALERVSASKPLEIDCFSRKHPFHTCETASFGRNGQFRGVGGVRGVCRRSGVGGVRPTKPGSRVRRDTCEVSPTAAYRRRHRIPCSGEYPRAHLVHDDGRVGFRNRKNSCPAGHSPIHGACSCAISPSCVRPPVYPIEVAVERHVGPCPASGPTKAWATSWSRICRTSSSSYFSAR